MLGWENHLSLEKITLSEDSSLIKIEFIGHGFGRKYDYGFDFDEDDSYSSAKMESFHELIASKKGVGKVYMNIEELSRPATYGEWKNLCALMR